MPYADLASIFNAAQQFKANERRAQLEASLPGARRQAFAGDLSSLAELAPSEMEAFRSKTPPKAIGDFDIFGKLPPIQQEAVARLGYSPETTRKAFTDPRFVPTLRALRREQEQRAKAGATRIEMSPTGNPGEGMMSLPTRAQGAVALGQVNAEKALSTINSLKELGNLDQYGTFASNISDFITSSRKKLGKNIAGEPTAEELADFNKQKKFNVLMNRLKSQGSYKDEQGNVHDLGIGEFMTSGMGLSDSVAAIEESLRNEYQVGQEALGQGLRVRTGRGGAPAQPSPLADDPLWDE